MKTHLDIRHEGTVGTEGRVGMTFDENSIAHLMSVLTDLYSNPTLAVVREYSTNARDAHVAAGCPERPIEVTLPNLMSNTLIIKDYGTGMSKDDITDHFSKYGWSSKRDTDDEVGQLGLGCKSGLAYTSQFTLITIQDGIKNTVLVTREESGGGVIQVIDTEQTDEGNGTEVQIPCTSYGIMNETAKDFFQYWDRGTVLLDGEEPDRCIWDEKVGHVRIDPDIVLIPHTGNGSLRKASMLVMGNVAYPIDNYKLPRELQTDSDWMRAVIRVPIGTINFVPSREALNYNKRTLETIQEAWDYIYHQLSKNVQDSVDQTKNAKDAWQIWRQWKNILRRKAIQLHYQHTPFVDYIDIVDKGRTLIMDLELYRGSGDRSQRVGETIDLQKVYDCVLHVVGHQGTAVAASTKERIRQYCTARGIERGKVIVYPKVFGQPWISNETCNRVRFDVIQAIQLPKDSKARPARQRSRYRTLLANTALDYVDELPDTVKCWLPAAFTKINRTEIVKFSGNKRVAVVLAADEKRFMRDHPNLPTWEDWTKQQIETVPLSGSDWDHFRWQVNGEPYDYGRKRGVIPYIFSMRDTNDHLLLDPDLKEMLVAYRASENSAARFANRVSACKEIKRYNGFLDVKLPDVPKAKHVTDAVEAMRKWYDGLLDVRGLNYDEWPTFIKGLNSYYIVKSSLHVIPVL